MKKTNESILVLLFFTMLSILFWYPALIPGKALFLKDLSVEIIPSRSFWSDSKGFALWNPYVYFGLPYSANPQFGAFYPLNIFFFFSPVWKGLSIFIIFHYILAGFFSYLFFREIEFSTPSSLVGSVAFCFGGFFCSLSQIIVLFSVVSWVFLSCLFLVRFIKYNFFSNILFLSLVFSIELLGGGDPQVMFGSLLLCLFAGLTYSVKSGIRFSYIKIFSGFSFALLIAIMVSSPYLFLGIEMLPLSNRWQGYEFQKAMVWSLTPKELLTLFFPNHFLNPESTLWLFGFLVPPSFLSSIYPGLLVFFLAILSFRGNRKFSICWLIMFFFGIFLSLGKYNPLYRAIYNILLFLGFFRIPEKWYFLSAFSISVLAVQGTESLLNKPVKFSGWFLFIIFISLGLALFLVSLSFHYSGLSSDSKIEGRVLFLYSSFFGSLSFLFSAFGFIFMKGKLRSKLFFGLAIVFLVYLDLFFAHFRLNAPGDSKFYIEKPEVVRELDQYKDSVEPLRIATFQPDAIEALKRASNIFELTRIRRDWLVPFFPVYYKLNDVLCKGAYYLYDFDLLEKALAQTVEPEQILARCAVKFSYRPLYGLTRIPSSLERAMIFYQAEIIADRERIIERWATFDFPFQKKIILEEKPKDMPLNQEIFAERARILSYKNERVIVEVDAKADGYLVLFDSYYPGWRAYLDGREVKVFRANYFFRAIVVPGGRHIAEFHYSPRSFRYGVFIAGFSIFLVLVFLLKNFIVP